MVQLIPIHHSKNHRWTVLVVLLLKSLIHIFSFKTGYKNFRKEYGQVLILPLFSLRPKTLVLWNNIRSFLLYLQWFLWGLFLVLSLEEVIGADDTYNTIHRDGSYEFGYNNPDSYHYADANRNNIVKGEFGGRNPATGKDMFQYLIIRSGQFTTHHINLKKLMLPERLVIIAHIELKISKIL